MSRKRDKPYFSRHTLYSGSRRHRCLSRPIIRCRCFGRRTHLPNGGRESELVLKIEIPVPGRWQVRSPLHQFTQTSSLSFVICRLLRKLDLFKSATTAEVQMSQRPCAVFQNPFHLGMLDECCSTAIPESKDTRKEEEEEESRGISKAFSFVK